MHDQFPQASLTLRLFAVILSCLFWAAAAMAQQPATNSLSAQPQIIDAVGSPTDRVSPAAQKQPVTTTPIASRPAGNISVSSAPAVKSNTGNSIDDYQNSLNALSKLYQDEVLRLEKQNSQSKELYSQGLIPRVELESNDQALADSRAKVEEVARQIAAANQPPSNASGPADFVASDRAWSTGNNRIDALIRYYGNQNSVDPYLIYCLMSQESKFASVATSPKGAQGLMQLMPGTAARYGVTNPYDVAQSIMGGTRYLKDLLKMFNGRVDLALAGYNAGENAVIKFGYTVPPYNETRNYVRLIIARYGKRS